MKVNISMGDGAVTQKADIQDMTSHLSWLMLYSGIRGISIKGYVAGMAQRIIANMEPYEEAPESVRIRGVVTKDDLGHMMSSMGISMLRIDELSKAEAKTVKARWKKMDEALLSAGGSGNVSTTQS